MTYTKRTHTTITFTLLMCYIAVCSKQNVPYGQVSEKSTGINEYDIFYGFNAEEYNPVTETQYLRARYYTPDTGTFLSNDTILGSVGNLNSQNRYTYAENDPVNNADPSGHSVANSSYARNMAANGMIDEILIMEVAGTLIQNENKAKAAFSSQLYKAQAVSYQDIEAIRNISGISQATADYYIQNGGLAALKAAINLNCVPGEIVNGTIRMFETNVNAAKASVNAQINTVKSNKTAENAAWVAEQARLEAEANAERPQTMFKYSDGIVFRESNREIIVLLRGRFAFKVGTYIERDTRFFALDNKENRKMLATFSYDDWLGLGGLLYSYGKGESSDYLSHRTPTGMANEFLAHYTTYVATMTNIQPNTLGETLNIHLEVADVGGLNADLDGFLWEWE